MRMPAPALRISPCTIHRGSSQLFAADIIGRPSVMGTWPSGIVMLTTGSAAAGDGRLAAAAGAGQLDAGLTYDNVQGFARR